MAFTRSGTLVDVVKREIYPATVTVDNGKIVKVERDKIAKTSLYLLPGFIDAHIHIESSMLIPSEFARLAVVHGTVATVSDPHEIGNVLGIEGIRYMIENGSKVPFHFYFGASSCVPATHFETAGAEILTSGIEELFKEDKLKYLSEMMNFPGVLNRDPEVMQKIAVAKAYGKPVDGHAPGLRGDAARDYCSAGITTDHECFTLEEALDKVKYGMHILIREGSAAKNYEALHTLLKTHPEQVMFCSDDKHPNELVEGHIDLLVRRSIVEHGYPVMDVLRAACYNPVKHYRLDVGLLQEGDSADFIVVNNVKDFQVLETFIKGNKVAEVGKTLISSISAEAPNQFKATPKKVEDFYVEEEGHTTIRVIQPEDGQLITHGAVFQAKIANHRVVPNLEKDILKIAVVNRYENAKPAVAFIQNFGLKKGAIASCIAHDSHNIIAVGTNDADLAEAVNLLIESKGGISAVAGNEKKVLPLPVAGIMSAEDGYEVARKYAEMDALAKQFGSTLHAPYMTLSFMALLVIPELKLSDKGLFDGTAFEFVEKV